MSVEATRVSNDELWARMQEMQQEIDGLRSQLSAPAAPVTSGPVAAGPVEDLQSRRSLLKKAGIGAAVTAAGVAAMTKPAAAADGDPLEAGETTIATSPTLLTGAGVANNNAFTVEDEDNYGSGSSYPATIGAYCTSATTGNALFAYQEGRTDDASDGYPIVAWATVSSRANLLLRSSLSDPRTTTYTHYLGEVIFDTNEDLWLCIQGGSPGTWRKIAGGDTAGALHPITPKRVWDTRFQGGAMSNGESRTISIKDGRVLSSSTIDEPNLVPEGATAIAFNITVVSTNPAGYLAVTPGDATEFTASSINWDKTAAVLGNGTLSTLDDNRQVKVWCSGSTHFIIDITGYYL